MLTEPDDAPSAAPLLSDTLPLPVDPEADAIDTDPLQPLVRLTVSAVTDTEPPLAPPPLPAVTPTLPLA